MNSTDYLRHLDTLIRRYPALEGCRNDIEHAFNLMRDTYKADGQLLPAGNCSSASDAAHTDGELLRAFQLPRKMIPRVATRY